MLPTYKQNSTPENTSQPLRAASYVRLSQKEKQAGGSITTQEESIKKYCEYQGWELVEIYIDDGYTGTNDKRPRFQDMMMDAEADRFDIAVCRTLDRFMRHSFLLNKHVNTLHEHGKALVTIADNIDTRDSSLSGKITRQLFGVLAEAESDKIGERISARRQRDKAERKWSMGKVSFGYGDKYKDIVEHEAVAVRLAYQLRAEGLGCDRVAVELNEAGFRTRSGKLFYGAYITDILRSLTYMGEHPWGFTVPPIVDAPLWHLVQRRMDESKRIRKQPRTDTSPLAGRMVCAADGYGLEIHTQPYGKKRKDFTCYNRRAKAHLDGSPKCTTPWISVEWAETEVTMVLFSMLNSPEGLKGCIENALKSLTEKQRRLGDTKAIDTDLAVLEANKTRLQKEYVEGRMSEGQWKTWYADYTKKEQALHQRKSAIDPEVRREVAELEGWLESAQAFLSDSADKHWVYAPGFGLMFFEDDKIGVWDSNGLAILPPSDHNYTALENNLGATVREKGRKGMLRDLVEQLDIKVMVNRDGSLDITGAFIPAQHVPVTASVSRKRHSHIPHSSTRIPFKASVPALVEGGVL